MPLIPSEFAEARSGVSGTWHKTGHPTLVSGRSPPVPCALVDYMLASGAPKSSVGATAAWAGE